MAPPLHTPWAKTKLAIRTWIAHTQPRSVVGIILPLVLCIIVASPVLFINFGQLSPDSLFYLTLGSNVHSGKGLLYLGEHVLLGTRGQQRPVLFPAVLIPLSFWIGGVSLESVLWVEKLFFFCTVIVIYLLGKELYGWPTGLAGAALAASSDYLLRFTGKLLLDGIQAFFVLVCLWLTLIALRRHSLRYALLAGLCLGIAFWVKETAIIFLLLPLILFLVIRESHWQFRHYLLVLIFWLGFAVLAIGWWSYYYSVTGNLYLLNTTAQIGYDLALKILLAGMCLAALILYYGFFRRKPEVTRSQQGLESYSRIIPETKALSPTIFTVLGLLIFASAIIVFTIILIRSSWPQREENNQISLFLALKLMGSFFQNQIVPSHPLLIFAPPGLLLLGWRAIKHHGDRFVLISLGLNIPVWIAISIPTYQDWSIRHLMVAYWLSYLVIGWLLIWMTSSLLTGLEHLAANRLSLQWIRDKQTGIRRLFLSLTILMVVFYSIQNSYTSVEASFSRDLQQNGIEVNFTFLDAANWLNTNVPRGTTVAVTFPYQGGLDFFTQSRLKTIELPLDNDDLQTQAGFKLVQSKLRLVSTLHPEGQRNLIYYRTTPGVLAREVYTIGHYTSLSLDDLILSLTTQSVDYLFITQGYWNNNFSQVPAYFYDSDAFQEVFVRRWEARGISVHIFKVLRDKLTMNNYPLTVDLDTMKRDLNTADQSKNYTEYQMLEALGLKTILLLGSDKETAPMYKKLGDIFLANGQTDLACAEYRLAVVSTPDRAKEYLPLAYKLASAYPDETGPKVLLGSIYTALDEIDLARNAYLVALRATGGRDESRAIAYRELGKIYLKEGDNQKSIDHFEQALQLSPFGALETRQQMLFAQGNLYQTRGQIDQAMFAYEQAFRMNQSTDTGETSAPLTDWTMFDFMRQSGTALIAAPEKNRVHPAVFIIDHEPRGVLFAHPPSSVSYTISVPTNSWLQFAPILSPEVWQPSKGDGVQFDIYIDDGHNHQSVFSKYVDPKNLLADRKWHDQQVDISRWAGQTITITFATGPGPNGDDHYDWAGWGEPRLVRPIAFNFLTELPNADHGGADKTQVRADQFTLDHEPRAILFQHPTNRVTYHVALPQRAQLYFGLGMDPSVWLPDKGDGVTYNIYVRTASKPNLLQQVFSNYIDPKHNLDDRHWLDYVVDLNPYSGQTVDIIFEASPGPAGNANFDWGGWSMPVLLADTLP